MSIIITVKRICMYIIHVYCHVAIVIVIGTMTTAIVHTNDCQTKDF